MFRSLRCLIASRVSFTNYSFFRDSVMMRQIRKMMQNETERNENDPRGRGRPKTFCSTFRINLARSRSSFCPSTECYKLHDFSTITSKFHVAVGFRVMRNIIPNTSSDLEQSGTSRKLFVFESRAVIFAIIITSDMKKIQPR